MPCLFLKGNSQCPLGDACRCHEKGCVKTAGSNCPDCGSEACDQECIYEYHSQQYSHLGG